MRRIVQSLAAGMLLFALMSSAAWAQATAQISGTVSDQSGAVLPGVDVSAIQTDTGATRNAVTNETGLYVLSNLPLGPYRVEASLPGFRTFVQTGLVLQVGSSPVVNPVLEVGAVAETVEVQANVVQVETRSSGVGQVIENTEILELPLNGRNVTQLITLAGAAVERVGTSDEVGGRNGGGSPQLNIGGGMIYGVAYTLDGADYQNTQNISGLQMPFPDALQEFKVETSGVTVSASKAAGISAVTKSGTNEFHGSLFEFHRNDLFNALNYFEPKESNLKRNQFGGTLGGPIIGDKLFFFGGYQGTTIRSSSPTEDFIPTDAMIAGDWTTFASAQCQGRQRNVRELAFGFIPTGFVNNTINPDRFSPAAMEVTRRVRANSPVPDECGLVRYSVPNRENFHQFIGRIDYQWSDRHSIFGRYTALQYNETLAYELTPNNILNSSSEGGDNLTQSFAFGSTYLIGSDMVNSFRLSANRMFNAQLGANDAPNAPFFDDCEIGINEYCDDTPGRTYFSISGGFTIGTNHDSEDATWFNSFSISDDVSLVRGNHQFAFGGSLGVSDDGTHDRWYAGGQHRFFPVLTGYGLGDFMIGTTTAYLDAGPANWRFRSWTPVLYFTDIWNATQTVTLNYGVRWEPYLPWISTEQGGHYMNFSLERFRAGTKSTVFPNAPSGMYFPGDPGHPGRRGANNRWGQFGPRVGLAWDVMGDGRTSLRASYSYAYARTGGHWYETPSVSAPWGNSMQLELVPTDDPWRNFAGGNQFPHVLGNFSPFGEAYATEYDTEPVQTGSWNLSLQRQIGDDWVVSAAYLGTQNTHLWFNNSLNAAVFFPGVSDANGECFAEGFTLNMGRPGATCSSAQNVNQRRRLNLERPGEDIGNLTQLDDNGVGNYHGMLLTVQRRVSSGVTLNGNYTWSHCINDGVYESHGGLNNANNVSYNKPNDRSFDRGNCDSDRRHIFNMTATAETPEFSNPTLRMLATGWRLSGIYRRSTGTALSISAGDDTALNGIRGVARENVQRGNQILADPYGDDSGRPFTSWLNPDAFESPALGTYGNVGRNSVSGPPQWAFDMALSRTFQFREAQQFEFRFEMFNVTNSFRPQNPNLSVNSRLFGQIRDTDDPRILQFALKYIF